MKEQNEQYGRLREQLDEHKFELPASGWAHMADILDGKQPVPQPQPPARQNRRKGLLWVLLSGLLLLVVGLGAQQLGVFPASWAASELGALPIPMLYAQERAPEEESVTSLRSEPSADKATLPATKAVIGFEPPASVPPSRSATPAAAPRSAQPLPVTIAEPTSIEREERAEELVALPTANEPVRPIAPTESSEVVPPPPATSTIATLSPGLLPVPEAALDAQPVDPVVPQRFSFGLKAGLDAQTRQTTALAGLFARYRLGEKWAIQLEPQYKFRSDANGQGLGLETGFTDTLFFPTEVRLDQRGSKITRLHFIEVPLTVLYRVHPRLQLLGGGQLTYVWNESQSARNTSFANQAADEFEAINYDEAAQQPSPAVIRWDAGLVFGVDYQITPALSADLRYVQGLYDLTDDAFFLQENDYLNSSLQLSIKWKW